MALSIMQRLNVQADQGLIINSFLAQMQGVQPPQIGKALEALVQHKLIRAKDNWISLTAYGAVHLYGDPDMTNETYTIEQRKAARYALMQEIYRQVNGSTTQAVSVWETGDSLQFPRALTQLTQSYLISQGLLQSRTIQGAVSLTHQGVVSVEGAQSTPDSPSTEYPPVNIVQNILQGVTITNSNVQVGVSHSSQTLGVDVQALVTFLSELRKVLPDLGLPPEKISDLETEIATSEALLKTPKPKWAFLKACFQSIKNILEEASGNVIGQKVVDNLPAIMKIIESLSS